MHDDEVCSLKSKLADTQKFARDLQGELAASRVACEGAVAANRLNEAEVTRLLADNIRLRDEAAARHGAAQPSMLRTRREPSDWERLATQTADLLLAEAEKYEFVAAALGVANEEIAALKAAALDRMPSLDDLVDPPRTAGRIFASLPVDRPLDAYGRRS